MSIWDSVKKFTQPYGEDDYDEYDDDDEVVDTYDDEDLEEAPAPRRTRKTSGSDSAFDFGLSSSPSSGSSSGFEGKVLNVSSGKQAVVLFRPNSFNDASKAADDLRAKRAVIVNMENVDKALARRVVDFLSGCTYALDGTVKKIAQSTYLFCPHNMDVVGDLENLPTEVESYI